MIRAFPTRYRSYYFRSRLEARWAYLFDALDLQWRYEPQCFDLGGLLYVPDFYLPEPRLWLEAKGVVDEASLSKAQRFGQHATLIFAPGDPLADVVTVYTPDSETTCWLGLDDQGLLMLADHATLDRTLTDAARDLVRQPDFLVSAQAAWRDERALARFYAAWRRAA